MPECVPRVHLPLGPWLCLRCFRAARGARSSNQACTSIRARRRPSSTCCRWRRPAKRVVARANGPPRPSCSAPGSPAQSHLARTRRRRALARLPAAAHRPRAGHRSPAPPAHRPRGWEEHRPKPPSLTSRRRGARVRNHCSCCSAEGSRCWRSAASAPRRCGGAVAPCHRRDRSARQRESFAESRARHALATSPVYHGDAQALPARTGKRREILPLGDAVEKVVRSGHRHTGRIASKAASGKVHFASWLVRLTLRERPPCARAACGWPGATTSAPIG